MDTHVPFDDIRIAPAGSEGARQITIGRQHKAVGMWPSVKTGLMNRWESKAELHDLYRCEADCAIVDFVAQPHTMTWISNGISRRFTPDRADYYGDGSIRFVEVKADKTRGLDADYRTKLAEAARIYEHLGHSFEIRDKSVIEAQPSFKAVMTIQSFRRTAICPLAFDRLRNHLTAGYGTLATALEAIGGDWPLAVFSAMLARRLLYIDITDGLQEHAEVRLVEAR